MADRPGAYKLLANSGLPKYTTGQRPPAAQWHDTGPQTAQASLFDHPPKAAKVAVAQSNKAAAVPTQSVKPVQPAQAVKLPVPAVAPVTAAVKQPEKVRTGGPARQVRGFCKKLWQQFIYGREGGPFRSPTVQAELALEKVTVLRNDLNEDDLEVVLVERKVGKGEKPLARLSKMEMTGEAWLRLIAPFRKKNSDSATSPKAEKNVSPELSARA